MLYCTVEYNLDPASFLGITRNVSRLLSKCALRSYFRGEWNNPEPDGIDEERLTSPMTTSVPDGVDEELFDLSHDHSCT